MEKHTSINHAEFRDKTMQNEQDNQKFLSNSGRIACNTWKKKT